MVILLTDGINNQGAIAPVTAAELAKAFGIRVYTIGVGTYGEAPYPVPTPFGVQLQNMPVEIDEGVLQQIANVTAETNHKKEEINHEEIVISTPRQESPEVRKGRVEYFNVSKGYGFIKDLSGTEKYFFHVSNALSELVENAIVIFDLERGKRGMNAINICISERTAD